MSTNIAIIMCKAFSISEQSHPHPALCYWGASCLHLRCLPASPYSLQKIHRFFCWILPRLAIVLDSVVIFTNRIYIRGENSIQSRELRITGPLNSGGCGRMKGCLLREATIKSVLRAVDSGVITISIFVAYQKLLQSLD